MAVKIMGNVKGKNGMPTTAPGGGTNYKVNTMGSGNLRDRGYPNEYYTGGGTTTPTDRPRTSTSSGGSGSKSSSSSSSSNMANAYNALLAAYRQNDYSDYLAQMRAAAQNAYDRGMSALNSAYDNQLSSLSSNLKETKNQLANQYNRSKNNINQDAEGSLRQAYINKMLSERNLGQQMSALGLNGGATETTLANMSNNYGNARNEINTTLNNNLSDLEGNYSDNLSQAMQAYNSAVANANLQRAQQAMSLENALANNQISALGEYQSLMQRENQNYLDLLKAAIANGASFSFNPSQANNAVQATAVEQAANPALVNNLTALQELMGAENTPGVSMPGMTVVNAASSNPYLYILNQLAQQRG